MISYAMDYPIESYMPAGPAVAVVAELAVVRGVMILQVKGRVENLYYSPLLLKDSSISIVG